MAKVDMDWDAVEALCEGGIKPPEQVFAKDVQTEAARMIGRIIDLDNARSRMANSLALLRTDYSPEDYYVTSKALELVFDRFGVLDDYMMAEALPAPAYTETPEGWNMQLRRPSSTGLFRIEFVNIDTNPAVDLEKVRYQAIAA